MNEPKVNEEDYINFLVASPRVVSGTEAARVQPNRGNAPAHDALTRLLHRVEPDPATLWSEVAPQIDRSGGVLVLDDSTLDKPYARKIDLVTRHWSGKHHAVVQGINLLTLLWTDGTALWPCDYRLYDKETDGLSKNDHARTVFTAAEERGFTPRCVVFDSWYSSLENLKAIRADGWTWLTQLRSNRLVNSDGTGTRPVRACLLSEEGTRVHLQGYGHVRVFLVVGRGGEPKYWATNDLGMEELTRLQYAEDAWGIEVYHRGLKQHCGVERAQVRAARAQRTHIGCAIRAFVRLELHRQRTGVGRWEAKTSLIRDTVRAYHAQLAYTLHPTA